MIAGAARRALAAFACALIVVVAAPVVASASGGGGGHEGSQAEATHAPDINWLDFSWEDEYDGPPFAMMIVNFAAMVLLVGWIAKPRLAKYLLSRHDSIKDALAESARLRDEARRQLDEYAERIAGVDAEVDKLVAEIRDQAEAEKQRILDHAQKQVDVVKRDAENRIAAEIDRARRQLEREVVTLAIAAAEKIVRDRATEQDQRQFVQEFIASVKDTAAAPAPEDRA